MLTKEIIQQIAQKNRVTPKEVEAEMKQALEFGRNSTSPKAQLVWNEISPNGQECDIDDFLKYCVKRIITH